MPLNWIAIIISVCALFIASLSFLFGPGVAVRGYHWWRNRQSRRKRLAAVKVQCVVKRSLSPNAHKGSTTSLDEYIRTTYLADGPRVFAVNVWATLQDAEPVTITSCRMEGEGIGLWETGTRTPKGIVLDKAATPYQVAGWGIERVIGRFKAKADIPQPYRVRAVLISAEDSGADAAVAVARWPARHGEREARPGDPHPAGHDPRGRQHASHSLGALGHGVGAGRGRRSADHLHGGRVPQPGGVAGRAGRAFRG